MKKASSSSVISTFIVCFIFWLLITGQLSAIFKGQVSLEVLIAGVLVCLLAALFSARFFIHEKAFWLCQPARLGNFLLYCIVIFPIELVKANVDVAIKALTPGLKIEPGIVKVPVSLKSEYGQAFLANSITLTPGTITMDIAEDLEETEPAATEAGAAIAKAESAPAAAPGTAAPAATPGSAAPAATTASAATLAATPGSAAPAAITAAKAEAAAPDANAAAPAADTAAAPTSAGRTYFYIHWLDVKTKDHEEAGEMIKGTMENYLRRVWE